MTLQFIDLRPGKTAEVLARALRAAGRVLTDISGCEIALSVSAVDQTPISRRIAAADQDAGAPVVGVSQGFAGPLSGQALLLFAEPTGLALIRRLLRQDDTPAFVTEMDAAALAEIANATVNLCIAELSAGIGVEIGTKAPVPQRGLAATLLRIFDEADDLQVVTLRLTVLAAQQEFHAELLFLLHEPEVDRFWRAATPRRPSAAPRDG